MQRLNCIKMPTREMPKQSGHHIAHSLQDVILVRQSFFGSDAALPPAGAVHRLLLLAPS